MSHEGESANQPVTLHMCPDCGRKFNEQALSKHIRVCQKVFQKKRKIFDSKQARQVEGQHQIPGSAAPRGHNAAIPKTAVSRKAKWKAQSEQFRAAMRACRGDTDAQVRKSTCCKALYCFYCWIKTNYLILD